ncbi:siderophore biosynthesis lipase/esteras-like protein [Tothia fuscella]|uniref:Siderophore biosynthesis lipase/esteras-like protein n=1 Tax=Tothia fuscella TaxID=1048955 RepID=A0A9P4TVX6_9PEZI|nr:siderophore biosynthesis lipase/esteras-like protein [Tothia fuscella]
MVTASAIQAGLLHRFSKRLVAFEFANSSGQPFKNLLLWVGGLSDGLSTCAYPQLLAKKVPPGWSLAQVELLSSLDGWGTSSLQADVKGISDAVSYFRKIIPRGKIVLMGHSTGCQDGMEYTVGKGRDDRSRIDGVILQAPVSDREAIIKDNSKEKIDSLLKTSKKWIDEGRGLDVLPAAIADPLFGSSKCYVTAYRAHSLMASGGDDDYFSSDLPDSTLKRTFGIMKKETPLLILISGDDEHMAASIDKQALGDRWSQFVKAGGGAVDEENGCIVPGAHHTLNEDNDQTFQELRKRVVSFLGKVEKGQFAPGSQL